MLVYPLGSERDEIRIRTLDPNKRFQIDFHNQNLLEVFCISIRW